jgi:hypothetical protein
MSERKRGDIRRVNGVVEWRGGKALVRDLGDDSFVALDGLVKVTGVPRARLLDALRAGELTGLEGVADEWFATPKSVRVWLERTGSK